MKRQELSNGELAAFFRELSLLVPNQGPAGALELMAEVSGPADRKLLTAMRDAVRGGGYLHEAMEEAGCFPTYARGLMAVSKDTGHLNDALEKLAEYYEGRERMERRMRSALLYPAVMLLLMVAVIGVLLVKVLPIFDDVYASLGGRLTGVAGGLLVLGRGLDKAMPVLWAVLAAAVVFFLCYAAIRPFREKAAALGRSWWGDMGAARKLNNAHLFHAIALCMENGNISPKETLELAAGLVEDVPPARARCVKCLEGLERGSDPEDALRESGLLSDRHYRLLKAAQKDASKDEAVRRIADDLYEEGEAALEEQVSRVEPALVLVCSVLVGLILLSVMLPLMHIMSAIG